MAKESELRPQKFTVVGAGPVGCIVAAFLSKGGYEVTLCDVIEELIKPSRGCCVFSLRCRCDTDHLNFRPVVVP